MSGGFAVADDVVGVAFAVPVAAVVCAAHCYFHSSLRCLVHRVCPL